MAVIGGTAMRETRHHRKAMEASDEAAAREFQRMYDKEVEAKAARVRFDCPICLENFCFDDSIQLDCSHRFCDGCFSAFLETHIREMRVAEDELICPMPTCDCRITALQVEGAIRRSALWDRFLSTRARRWRPKSWKDDQEQVWECSNVACKCSFLAPVNLDNVTCPSCKTLIRLETTFDVGDTAADEAFEELLKEEAWQRCPVCRAPSMRDQGCNFITCSSEKCRGKTYYCYLCGVHLDRTQHFVHFPMGIFENVCERIDRRNDPTMPKAQYPEPNADDFLSVFMRWLRS